MLESFLTLFLLATSADKLGPKLFDTLMESLKELFEKYDFEKKAADDNKDLACKE